MAMVIPRARCSGALSDGSQGLAGQVLVIRGGQGVCRDRHSQSMPTFKWPRFVPNFWRILALSSFSENDPMQNGSFDDDNE